MKRELIKKVRAPAKCQEPPPLVICCMVSDLTSGRTRDDLFVSDIRQPLIYPDLRYSGLPGVQNISYLQLYFSITKAPVCTTSPKTKILVIYMPSQV